MKVGIFIAPSHTVPPEEGNLLAPWILAGELADGLVENGNNVHLFAAKGSKTKAILHDYGIEPTTFLEKSLPADKFLKKIIEDEEKLFYEMLGTAKKEKIDVLHLNQTRRVYEWIDKWGRDLRFVFTIHNFISEETVREVERLKLLGNCYFVSISNAQRGTNKDDFIETVYHGIDVAQFPFETKGSDYFLETGRVVPEKGFDDGIDACIQAGTNLLITGQVYEHIEKDMKYFESALKPKIDGKKIILKRDLLRHDLVKHYQMAKALLFPVKWEEPFGLVMIEAMSCGSPVIAYARGSTPEIVVDGVTGFLVNESDSNHRGEFIIKKSGVEGLVEAIRLINNMTSETYEKMRKAARRRIEDNFRLQNMVEGYEKVYKKILGGL